MNEEKVWSEQFLDALCGPWPVIVGLGFMVAGGGYVLAHVIAAVVA